MAMGALRALREAGLHVPQDIALIGFDDIAASANSEPPLSTVRQPIEKMGTSAVITLIDVINEPESDKRNVIFQPELVIRSTCGEKLTRIQEEGGDAQETVPVENN
jgi:LacI family transcriptional regulator